MTHENNTPPHCQLIILSLGQYAALANCVKGANALSCVALSGVVPSRGSNEILSDGVGLAAGLAQTIAEKQARIESQIPNISGVLIKISKTKASRGQKKSDELSDVTGRHLIAVYSASAG
jgi:hypothetical protein